MRSSSTPVRSALAVLGAALALAAGACSSGGSGSDAAESDAATTTTTGLPPCPAADAPPTVDPVGSTAAGDLITEATVDPGPHSVLTAVVDVTTAAPATVAVTATSADGHDLGVPAADAAADHHEVALLGMRAQTDYAVTVTATAADGTTDTVDLTFSSGSLPADLPPLETTVSDPAAMAPGITLFDVIWWGAGDDATCAPPQPADGGLVLGVDPAGEVVWYYQSPQQITDVSMTDRGTLVMSAHDVLIREIDLLGTTQRELGGRVATELVPIDLEGHPTTTDDTRPADLDSSHHEVYELANGNLLTISTEVVHFDEADAKGLCDGKTDREGNPVPDPTGIVADVFVELDWQGNVVHRWPLTDYVDPLQRPGAEMCAPPNPLAPPSWFYPDEQGLRDWSHANAVVLDEAENQLVVSIRHLDAVIAIRYQDDASGPAGELLWELGPNGTLDLTTGSYAYHGHAIEPEGDGTYLYYDNGNGRPGTTATGGTEPNYSRAVLYRVDPEAGTATQVWEHRDVTPEGDPVSAGFLGDADRQPNGNVLITHGGASTADGVEYSRIVEVVPNLDGGDDRTVFDLTLGDRKTVGYTAYRADRVPSLYGT